MNKLIAGNTVALVFNREYESKLSLKSLKGNLILSEFNFSQSVIKCKSSSFNRAQWKCSQLSMLSENGVKSIFSCLIQHMLPKRQGGHPGGEA